MKKKREKKKPRITRMNTDKRGRREREYEDC